MNHRNSSMGKLRERTRDTVAIQDKTIESEYLEVLATQASRVPLPVFVADLIIASLAASYFPVAVWGGWLLLVSLIPISGAVQTKKEFANALG